MLPIEHVDVDAAAAGAGVDAEQTDHPWLCLRMSHPMASPCHEMQALDAN